jgi:hypothetical protein
MLNAAFKSQETRIPLNRTRLVGNNTAIRVPLLTKPYIVGERDESKLGLPRDYHDIVRQHLRAQMPKRRFTSFVGSRSEPSLFNVNSD